MTAIEWLEELIECGADLEQIKKCLPRAKEMEKQQQGYSEKEVLAILFELSCNNDTDKEETEEWFEQFKKS